MIELSAGNLIDNGHAKTRNGTSFFLSAAERLLFSRAHMFEIIIIKSSRKILSRTLEKFNFCCFQSSSLSSASSTKRKYAKRKNATAGSWNHGNGQISHHPTYKRRRSKYEFMSAKQNRKNLPHRFDSSFILRHVCCLNVLNAPVNNHHERKIERVYAVNDWGKVWESENFQVSIIS